MPGIADQDAWPRSPRWQDEHACSLTNDWQAVDRALRAISWRRATLDAEEAHWLRAAESLQIWRHLGMVSAIDYMERAMGYAPRTAQERLRVARSLAALPELNEALAAGRLHYSAVRELTRVATPATEAAWREAALGRNLRQIEELVAEHRPGDLPDDPPDPEARSRVVRLELTASTFALLRQARQALDEEHGSHLSDDQLVAALCNAVLDGAPKAEPSGRARYQIAVTICERCRQGWQDGAGAKIAIAEAAVDRAMCDAQHIGSLDDDAPARAYQDVPPSVARLVWRRDHGRCRVPGCRSARGLELHHIVHRTQGGSHEASNLVLVCSACHLAHHEHRLTLSGTADHLEVRRREVQPLPADAHGYARRAHPDASITATGHVNTPAAASAHGGANVTSDAQKNATDTPGVPGNAVTKDGVPRNTIPAASSHVSTFTAPMAGVPSARVDAPASARAPMREPTRLELAILRTQAKQALTRLGWKPSIAAAAVAAAAMHTERELSLEHLIRAALRQCPKPSE